MDGGFEFLHYDFFKPIVTISGLTAFGGVGYLLEKYSNIESWQILILSILIGIAIGILMVFVYIKPMKKSENSISYSVGSLPGSIGEVSITIPSKGSGEVIIKVGAGLTNHIAESIDNVEIKNGEKIVVVDVKDKILFVSKLNL
ncbi:putative membrane protein YuaF [compost metagenome]